jgi:hypothetical protein
MPQVTTFGWLDSEAELARSKRPTSRVTATKMTSWRRYVRETVRKPSWVPLYDVPPTAIVYGRADHLLTVLATPTNMEEG